VQQNSGNLLRPEFRRNFSSDILIALRDSNPNFKSPMLFPAYDVQKTFLNPYSLHLETFWTNIRDVERSWFDKTRFNMS
jgi:hypothetical protein